MKLSDLTRAVETQSAVGQKVNSTDSNSSLSWNGSNNQPPVGRYYPVGTGFAEGRRQASPFTHK